MSSDYKLVQKPISDPVRLGGMVAGILFSLCFLISPLKAQPPKKPPAVVVQPAKKITAIQPLVFVGTTEPQRTSTVGSAVAGRVLYLKAEEGDFVSGPKELAENEDKASLPKDVVAGQAVVQLKTETIQLEVDAARAELASREAILAQLVETVPAEIAQAKATAESTKESLAISENKRKRLEQLSQRNGTVIQLDLEMAQSEHVRAVESKTLADEKLRVLEATKTARIQQAQAQVDFQKAEVERLEDQLSKFTIRAPFDGYIVSFQTEAGAWITQGAAAFDIVQIDPLEVRFFVAEEYLAPIQKVAAQKDPSQITVQLTFDSLPGETFTGSLWRIIPQADRRSRNFPIILRVPNPLVDGVRKLQAGMLAKVSVPLGKPVDQIAINKDALVLGGTRPSVMVAKKSEDGKKVTVERRDVEIVSSQGDWFLVNGDIREGDLVVVRGNERLAERSEVIIQATLEDLPSSEPAAAANGQ